MRFSHYCFIVISFFLLLNFSATDKVFAQELEEKEAIKKMKSKKKKIKKAEKKIKKVGKSVKKKTKKVKKKTNKLKQNKLKKKTKKSKNKLSEVGQNVKKKTIKSEKRLKNVGQNVKVKTKKRKNEMGNVGQNLKKKTLNSEKKMSAVGLDIKVKTKKRKNETGNVGLTPKKKTLKTEKKLGEVGLNRNVKTKRRKNVTGNVGITTRKKTLKTEKKLGEVGLNIKVKTKKNNSTHLARRNYIVVKRQKRKSNSFKNFLNNLFGGFAKNKADKKSRELLVKNYVYIRRKHPSSSTKHVGEYVLKAPKRTLKEISNDYQNKLSYKKSKEVLKTPFYKKDWRHPSHHYNQMKFKSSSNKKNRYRKLRILRNKLKPNSIHPKYIRDGHKSKTRYDGKEAKIWYD